MKTYTYKTGERAVFINDQKVIIDDTVAKILEHFEGVIANNHPETTAFNSASKHKIVEHAANFEIEEINKEINGAKIEAAILRKRGDGEIMGMRLVQDGEDIDLSPFDVNQVYDSIK